MFIINDAINQIAQIDETAAVNKLRQQRPVVLSATQASLNALFSSEITSISLNERAYVAIYVANLNQQPALTAFYQDKFNELSPELLNLIQQNKLTLIPDLRLQKILNFTQQVTLAPIEANELLLQDLIRAGLTTQAIVVLTQLIGFVSYQLRVISGIKALNQYIK